MTSPTLAGLAVGISGALASTAVGVLVDASPAFGVLACASWAVIGAQTSDAVREQPRRRP